MSDEATGTDNSSSHAVRAHKGRGAVSSLPGRFAQRQIAPDNDGCHSSPAPETTLRPMRAKSIISSNTSPDIPFDRSINPYLGCEHGCVYCYARPSHSYLDLSPGIDFETQIYYKPNAAERLLAAWRKPGYVCQPITIGANTDPYQPAEKKLRITRGLLSLFLEHAHPVSIITKSHLLERDIDLLGELARLGLVTVAVSVPTMNADLKRILEPRVPAAAKRFRLIEDLVAADIPVSVLLAPIIPALNDTEIETILARTAACGARHANWILLRLPHEMRQIFVEWLDTHLPDRAARVMSLMRQASGGADYDARFVKRQRGSGPYAAMIERRFKVASRRLGLNTGRSTRPLDCGQFRPPAQPQMTLKFD